MAAGTTFKACGCRDEEGKLLGKKCPKLRREGGGWSRHHGSWYYQLELPPRLDGGRRNPIRRGGFGTQDAAEAEIAKGRELLAIVVEDVDRDRIAELMLATLKETKALPDPEEVRRRFETQQILDGRLTTGSGWRCGSRGARRFATTPAAPTNPTSVST